MISGTINAPGIARLKVLKIDRWRKRVLIRTWVADANETPTERWYKMNDEHHQNIYFKVES